jgi:S1/P1 Nuclease/HAD superfamily, subfamily IIIB (Acid phosphatase)
MLKKVTRALAAAALVFVAQASHAYGQEGHSIVAEIAQRRLDPAAQVAVQRVLGASMASVASWADDVRGARRETYNLHFVDIPLASGSYDAARDCPSSGKGDCIVAELDRLRNAIACAPTALERKDALEFAIHFIGDIHQPLHTVLEKLGGNGQQIAGVVQAATCSRDGCDVKQFGNLHVLWDSGLIHMSYWSWGAYVEKLEAGPLKDPYVLQLGNSTNVVDWAQETHAVAQQIWNPRAPLDNNGALVIDDAYYRMAMPLLDKELAVAGLRLARFLNDAYSSASCSIAPKNNLGDLKAELRQYYGEATEGGKTRYELEQASVAGEARAYLLARIADAKVARPAIVLDIDETALSNLEQLKIDDFGYIASGPCSFDPGHACSSSEWDKTQKATAIVATRNLFQAAIDNKVAVFFVTGRRESESERLATEGNLAKVGFGGYKHLYLRPMGADGGASVTEYKSAMRAKIEAEGYRIVVNLGDQPSDLAGGHADRAFQMPNPFYRIP